MSKFTEDIARYRSTGLHGRRLWLNPAIWSIAVYRLGNWLYIAKPSPLIRIPLQVVFFFTYMFCEVVLEMSIDPHATIGGGLFIGHSGGIHINPDTVIGSNCDIAHHVTIGASAMGRKGAPTLGDLVYVGTGATVIGKIKVGSGAKIAANTLVMSNIPEGATVMGVPGRIVMRARKSVETPALPVVETTDAK